MASIRLIKKDIDYLVGEVISDCYLTVYFHPEKKQEIVSVMEEAVELRNSLFSQVKPKEKHNPSLVKKHYAHMRRELMEKVDGLFVKLSGISSKK
ncbi:hypothetical protein [Gallalistipes aquisgranensis]|uniref:hypothetical protein n=1 Tax=Gallalistipes aquisgranensis TaxID=2779358 RepID=UPI001CF81373|nr:hypothetical protein [Gallalistipes aquisgranensis]MBE5032960.1 hypothetical protein [Gallalistipes aquisgranensis]